MSDIRKQRIVIFKSQETKVCDYTSLLPEENSHTIAQGRGNQKIPLSPSCKDRAGTMGKQRRPDITKLCTGEERASREIYRESSLSLQLRVLTRSCVRRHSPKRGTKTSRDLLQELDHAIMETEKSRDVQFARWRTRKASDIIYSKSKCWRIKGPMV